MASIPFDLNNFLHSLPLLKTHIDDLVDNVLELIFTKLPQYKHLATCKCVSKRWNSIISNPDFARQLSRNHYPFTLFIEGNDGTRVISEHPYFQRYELCLDFILVSLTTYLYSFAIVAHHDELVVVYQVISPEEAVYCIANPLTKRVVPVFITWAQAKYKYPVKVLSSSGGYCWPYCLVGFAGIVDEICSIKSTTLDNHDTRGFRIVRVMKQDDELVIQIYSSETGLWRTYPFNFSGVWHPKYDDAITWNDKVHWHLRDQILVVDPFDDDNVVPYFINLPSEIHTQASVLGVCQNRLQIAQLDSDRVTGNFHRIRVWDFDDYEDNFCHNSNKIAKLRLVINFALKPSLIAKVIPSTDQVLSNASHSYGRKDGVVCCHPNDPEIVYLIYMDMLLRCNVVTGNLKLVAHYKNFCCTRYLFLHPALMPL